MGFDFGLYILHLITPGQARGMKGIGFSTYALTPLKQFEYHYEEKMEEIGTPCPNHASRRDLTWENPTLDMDRLWEGSWGIRYRGRPPNPNKASARLVIARPPPIFKMLDPPDPGPIDPQK